MAAKTTKFALSTSYSKYLTFQVFHFSVDESPVRDESSVRGPGPDRVTSDLLRAREALHPGEESDIPRASRVRTADSIRQRLDNMNEQFTAIQHMSDNMEHDFKNTKLVGYLPPYNIPPSIQQYLPLYNTTSVYTTVPPSIQHTSFYTT